jgi:hypothetical protein
MYQQFDSPSGDTTPTFSVSNLPTSEMVPVTMDIEDGAELLSVTTSDALLTQAPSETAEKPAKLQDWICGIVARLRGFYPRQGYAAQDSSEESDAPEELPPCAQSEAITYQDFVEESRLYGDERQRFPVRNSRLELIPMYIQVKYEPGKFKRANEYYPENLATVPVIVETGRQRIDSWDSSPLCRIFDHMFPNVRISQCMVSTETAIIYNELRHYQDNCFVRAMVFLLKRESVKDLLAVIDQLYLSGLEVISFDVQLRILQLIDGDFEPYDVLNRCGRPLLAPMEDTSTSALPELKGIKLYPKPGNTLAFFQTKHGAHVVPIKLAALNSCNPCRLSECQTCDSKNWSQVACQTHADRSDCMTKRFDAGVNQVMFFKGAEMRYFYRGANAPLKVAGQWPAKWWTTNLTLDCDRVAAKAKGIDVILPGFRGMFCSAVRCSWNPLRWVRTFVESVRHPWIVGSGTEGFVGNCAGVLDHAAPKWEGGVLVPGDASRYSQAPILKRAEGIKTSAYGLSDVYEFTAQANLAAEYLDGTATRVWVSKVRPCEDMMTAKLPLLFIYLLFLVFLSLYLLFGYAIEHLGQSLLLLMPVLMVMLILHLVYMFSRKWYVITRDTVTDVRPMFPGDHEAQERFNVAWHSFVIARTQPELSSLWQVVSGILKSRDFQNTTPADRAYELLLAMWSVDYRSKIVAAAKRQTACHTEYFLPEKPYDVKDCHSCGNSPPWRLGSKGRWFSMNCPNCWAGNASQAAMDAAQGKFVATGYTGMVVSHAKQLPLNPDVVVEAPVGATHGIFGSNHTASEVGYVPHRVVRKGRKTVIRANAPQDTKEKPGRTKLLGLGYLVSGAPPMVTDPTPLSTRDALLVRAFKEKKAPPPGMHRRWNHVEKLLPTILRGTNSSLWDEQIHFRDGTDDFEEWVKAFPGSRQRVLRRVKAIYDEVGPDAFRMDQFLAFVKTEKLPGFKVDEAIGLLALESYKPRLIQGPADITHVLAGPTLRQVLFALKRAWDKDSPIFYACTSPEQLDEWFNRHFLPGLTTFVMGDYSMFDRTIGKEALGCVTKIYRHILQAVPEYFWHILDIWARPKGKCGFNTGIKYACDYMNASGRDDTALINALLNGIVITVSMAATLNRVRVEAVTEQMIRKMQVDCKLGVVGDDSLWLMSVPFTQNQLELLCSHIRSFGFMIDSTKSELSQNPFRCVFLGQRPYPVAGRWYWGPTLGRRLYKHHWCIYKGGDPYAWLYGVADMEARCYPHVPILGDMGRQVCKVLKGSKKTPYEDPEARHKLSERTERVPDYDVGTLNYVAAGYDIDGETLRDLVRLINGVVRFPFMVDHPATEAFVTQDAM